MITIRIATLLRIERRITAFVPMRVWHYAVVAPAKLLQQLGVLDIAFELEPPPYRLYVRAGARSSDSICITWSDRGSAEVYTERSTKWITG